MCVLQSVVLCVCRCTCEPTGGTFPFNFNVKGMLQASGYMGSWCWEGAWITLCVWVCVRERACVCVWRKGEIMNLSIDTYHLLCPTVSCFSFASRVSCECNRSDLLVQRVCFTDTWWVSGAQLQGMYVCVCMCAGRPWTLFSVLLTLSYSEELTKCAILMLFFWSVTLRF